MPPAPVLWLSLLPSVQVRTFYAQRLRDVGFTRASTRRCLCRHYNTCPRSGPHFRGVRVSDHRSAFYSFAPAICSLLTLCRVALPADPNLECTAYYYAPSGQFVHNFPTIWQPATLLANDSAGQAMWSKIAGSIPNIAPKGQLNGSTINVTYDNANDPDCCEFSFLPSPPPFGSDSWGWRGELGPRVVHVAKDMHAKSAPRHLTWCPLMRRLSRSRFLPRFAR